MTPIIPYPSNLRHALTQLLPHLTTSYCLAEQYSQLEKQLASSAGQRYGYILGLGGTFSGPSSELELAAGLSGHVNYSLGEKSAFSVHSGFSSSGDGASMVRSNSGPILTGSPDLAFASLSRQSEPLVTPGYAPKHGTEVSGSHFSVSQPSAA